MPRWAISASPPILDPHRRRPVPVPQPGRPPGDPQVLAAPLDAEAPTAGQPGAEIGPAGGMAPGHAGGWSARAATTVRPVR